MLKFYFKFALRTFWKDKFFSTLNVIGLSIGIAVSVIILLYLQNDLNYDKSNLKYKQIYRVVTNVKAPGVEFHPASSAQEIGELLQQNIPEVLSYVRFAGLGQSLVTIQEKGQENKYNENYLFETDSTVFGIFTYPFITGNPKTALTNKSSIVLTEKLAQSYFGDEAALGKTVLLGEGKQPYTVTGVMENLPDNSHLKFDALLSGIEDRNWNDADGSLNSESLWNPNVYTYLLVTEGFDATDFYSKFQPVYDRYFKPFGDKVNGKLDLALESLANIHFHSTQEYDEPQGNIAYIYAFGSIGIFILLLACINYMNMATARSGNRAKEIGIRKVLGSSRKALLLSFLGESLIMSVTATAIALGLVELIFLATPFNSLIGKQLTLNVTQNPVLLVGIFAITLFTGMLSGSYPALYLPSINIINSLKGAFKSSSAGLVMRKTLVIIQFTISITVITCTLLMKDQINFLRTTDLGFNKDQLLYIPLQDTLVQRQIPAIKHELLQNPDILATATAYSIPGIQVGNSVFKVESDSGMNNQAFRTLWVDKEFLNTMDIQLLAGRNFQDQVENDKNAKSYIINETAARQLGWYFPDDKDSKIEDALNKEIMGFHSDTPGHVVGIVKDFNVSSLHNPIEPTLILPVSDNEGSVMYFRLKNDKIPQALAFIQNKWSDYDPNHPFDYAFLDQSFNQQYQADEQQGNLISILSAICLSISLLGILGLSAFSAEQRTKEIGVRKVLGAKINQIVYLLFQNVMYLVMIASLIAAPIAFFLSKWWMEDFAYKIPINVGWFLFAAISSIGVAFLTTSFHSLKTARKNPVNSLRSE